MQNIESLIKNLGSKKLRITKLRKSLLQILLKSKEPLSVEDLIFSLSKYKINVHKTSIYRQLDVLKKVEIVREIQFGEKKKRYEIFPDNHHHHLVCNDCGQIEDVELKKDLDTEEKIITQNKNFKIINHSLEFYGICGKCQMSSKS